ncbi:proteasome activator [Actinomadura macra]|uniref:proteasome activator n=1 Tax=Actinomadura macra TaxID=46164 RepID=UPI0008361EE0|nr:proteasome activator [Actinomadura macra]
MTGRLREDENRRVTAQPPPHITVLIGESGESGRGHRVTEPARLMRIWKLLTAVNAELHAGAVTHAGVLRAARILGRIREDATRCVSPPLADELRRLIPPLGENPTADDVRVAYAGALGWFDSLLSAMLLQIATQEGRASLGLRPGRNTPPNRRGRP